MKIMHLADLHIGKIVNGYNMLEDQRYILQQILEAMIDRKIELLLIAGDVYDRTIPAVEAVVLFDWFLSELTDMKIKVIIINGNHDSVDRLSFGNSIFSKNNIHISKPFNGNIENVSFEDEYGKITVYMLPFFKPMLARHIYENQDIVSYEDGVREAVNRIELNQNDRNIIISHNFVVASGEEVIESDSENMISVGGVDKVNYKIFDGFDYVALGHIHRPQKVGRDSVRYAGSPLKYSFSEVNHKKALPIIELKEKGNISLEYEELRPIRDLRIIRDTLDNLTSNKWTSVGNVEDYIEAILTDDMELLDPIKELKRYYPNIMIVQQERYMKTESSELRKVEIKNKKPMELIEEFFDYNNTELDEAIKNIVVDMYEEGIKRCKE